MELTPKQKTALDALRQIGVPTSFKQIFMVKPGEFAGKEQLKNVLDQLRNLKLVKRQGNGQFALTNERTKVFTPMLSPVAAPAITMSPCAVVDEMSLHGSSSEDQPVYDPLGAIDALSERLQQKPPVIEHLDLKLQVLDRLVETLDPSIGKVLSAIRLDIS